MARSKSSHRWLREHFNDEYVKQAQREGYRSRAIYKIKELDEKKNLLHPGMTVIDLGAAPGGWTQYLVEKLQGRGKIIALDILPMDPLPGVDIVQGDFHDDNVLAELMTHVPKDGVDLLLSDMAPNMSGNISVDIPRAMALVELAFDLASSVLKPGGHLLMKVFHGEGFDELLKLARTQFEQVMVRKPAASRPRSREAYLLAKGYKL
ncbi:MAG: 23S rRNA (uridine(2552)-2'-O)-methyltransferase RlmE [Legionella sp.]|jgi:23S rRNA (uridine2552-2'-O)-methyltransferase|nr:23S rRNA (uridine(2552)-2'-O)-methyltransferase RlmE [Legionella sp.]